MASNSAREPRQRPMPDEKLVRVFDTEQESEALIVRGLLESSGIDADVTSLDAPQDILPGVGGTVILVREEDAPEARRLIEEYRQSPSTDDTAEVDIVDDISEPPER
jgi:putative signal transducing protein